jgi:hypothetical protein
MNLHRNHFAVTARFSSHMLWLLILVQFSRGSDVRAQSSAKLFLNQERVVFVEVTKVVDKSSSLRKEPLKHFLVGIKVLGHLPPGEHSTEQELSITRVNDPELLTWGAPPGTQDWFPLEVGKRAVIAFNGKDIPAANKLLPLQASAGYRAEDVWRACATFYEAVNRPKAEEAAVLAKQLREQKQRLGPMFFHLVDAYDRRIVDDTEFSLAAAQYLSNREVPLSSRIGILRYLHEAIAREDRANRALVLAVVGVVRQANKAGLHPTALGNLLTSLSQQFVSGKRKTALPEVEPSSRHEIRDLVLDPKLVEDVRYIMPILNWLEGKEPGAIAIPPSSEPPRADRKLTVQPATKPKETPPEGGGAPGVLHHEDQGRFPWWPVVTNLALLALTVLVLLVAFWRRTGAT